MKGKKGARGRNLLLSSSSSSSSFFYSFFLVCWSGGCTPQDRAILSLVSLTCGIKKNERKTEKQNRGKAHPATAVWRRADSDGGRQQQQQRGQGHGRGVVGRARAHPRVWARPGRRTRGPPTVVRSAQVLNKESGKPDQAKRTGHAAQRMREC